MRYLYYCNSTYQLLNIMNLHWHRKYAGFENIDNYMGDVFILNTFSGAEKIFEIVSKNNIFHKVVLIEKTFNKGKLHSIFSVIDGISPRFYFKDKYDIDIKEIENKYDFIVTPKYSIVVDQLYRLNKNAQLDLYEDGIGSYYLDIPFEASSKIFRKTRNLFCKKSFYDYRHLYVVNKDLYLSKNEDRVVEIPKFDKKYLENIKQLFSEYITNNYEDRDIYWISQFLNNVKFNEMVDEILNVVKDYKNETVFVQHPRMHLDNKYNFLEADGKQIWELQLLGMNNINDKLLISIHSTACFSAKMLYDYEPYIIMFYKMGDNEVTHVTDEFEQIVQRFRNSYSNPEKVMIPENMDEFKLCLNKYLNR